MMRATPEAQRRLLDLQELDTNLSQLAHRKGSLPELEDIRHAETALDSARDALREAKTAADGISRRIKAIEGDIEDTQAHIDKDRARMDSGKVPAKELESLAHEVETLRARVSAAEEDQLVLMEEQEQHDAIVTKAVRDEDRAASRLADLQSRRDAAFALIAADAQARQADRDRIAAELPTDLVAVYEKARASRGVGAALLRARRCEGCRLELSGTDLAAARGAAADDVVQCEECRCVLVRTEESGL